jgi:hypothetical protein
MIPGIHNIQSIGSSPLKRGVKKDINLPRDQVYAGGGGAGQISTKIGSTWLPAMAREGQQSN